MWGYNNILLHIEHQLEPRTGISIKNEVENTKENQKI